MKQLLICYCGRKFYIVGGSPEGECPHCGRMVDAEEIDGFDGDEQC